MDKDKSPKKIYLKKIDIQSSDNIFFKKRLDEYMNSYEKYFDRAIPSVIHTETNEPRKLLNDKRNSYYISFSLKKTKNERNLPLLTSSFKKDISVLHNKNTQIISKKHLGGSMSVSDKEIEAVFDNFRLIKRKNLKKENVHSNNNNMKLQMQENALCRYIHHKTESENMKNKLSHSLQRGKKKLLMNSIEDFRVKNENKMLFSRISRNKDYWYDSLRQPLEKEKLSTKTFFKNFGTYQNPKWKITSMKMLTERIRNPEHHWLGGNTVSTSNINLKKNNWMWSKNLDDLSEEPEDTEGNNESEDQRNTEFIGLNVVGKDLLEFEVGHFNDMKSRAKRFYYSQVQNSPSDGFEILPKKKRKMVLKIE